MDQAEVIVPPETVLELYEVEHQEIRYDGSNTSTGSLLTVQRSRLEVSLASLTITALASDWRPADSS